ncbi:hypothetical protein CW713_06885 [Methanophagales archaeon]|nr:MAG: hypothetical protein CW713_06885 [Methanophagales archaeon]
MAKKKQADHCVTLVGYDDTGGYWIIKNSWGPLWEEGGYGSVYYESEEYICPSPLLKKRR